MSGGHFDYFHSKINYLLEDMEIDNSFKSEFRSTYQFYMDWLKLTSKMMKDLDYHISGDKVIKSEKRYKNKLIKEIENIIKIHN